MPPLSVFEVHRRQVAEQVGLSPGSSTAISLGLWDILHSEQLAGSMREPVAQFLRLHCRGRRLHAHSPPLLFLLR